MARKPTPVAAEPAAADTPAADTPAADTPTTDPATPPADQPDAGDPPAAVELVKVRVLVDRPTRRINDVIELPADQAAAALTEEWGDPDPAAVAYAEALRS